MGHRLPNVTLFVLTNVGRERPGTYKSCYPWSIAQNQWQIPGASFPSRIEFSVLALNFPHIDKAFLCQTVDIY